MNLFDLRNRSDPTIRKSPVFIRACLLAQEWDLAAHNCKTHTWQMLVLQPENDTIRERLASIVSQVERV